MKTFILLLITTLLRLSNNQTPPLREACSSTQELATCNIDKEGRQPAIEKWQEALKDCNDLDLSPHTDIASIYQKLGKISFEASQETPDRAAQHHFHQSTTAYRQYRYAEAHHHLTKWQQAHAEKSGFAYMKNLGTSLSWKVRLSLCQSLPSPLPSLIVNLTEPCIGYYITWLDIIACLDILVYIGIKLSTSRYQQKPHSDDLIEYPLNDQVVFPTRSLAVTNDRILFYTKRSMLAGWRPSGENPFTEFFRDVKDIQMSTDSKLAVLFKKRILIHPNNILKMLKNDEHCTKITWSPSSHQLLVYDKKKAKAYVFDRKGKKKDEVKVAPNIQSIHWSHDDTWLFVREDGLDCIVPGHSPYLKEKIKDTLTLFPDVLITILLDYLGSNKLYSIKKQGKKYTDAALSHTRDLFAIADNAQIRTYKLAGGEMELLHDNPLPLPSSNKTFQLGWLPNNQGLLFIRKNRIFRLLFSKNTIEPFLEKEIDTYFQKATHYWTKFKVTKLATSPNGKYTAFIVKDHYRKERFLCYRHPNPVKCFSLNKWMLGSLLFTIICKVDYFLRFQGASDTI